MKRFSLKALLSIVALAGIVFALIAHFYFGPNSVIQIESLEDWESITKNSRCVLFVDGDWNGEMVAVRKPFQNFAKWGRSEGLRPLTLTISAGDQDYAWEICQQLWDQIPEARSQHGLKHLGGAGRVVWLDNGKVVDYEWCVFLTNWNNVDDIDHLKERTQTNFK